MMHWQVRFDPGNPLGQADILRQALSNRWCDRVTVYAAPASRMLANEVLTAPEVDLNQWFSKVALVIVEQQEEADHGGKEALL